MRFIHRKKTHWIQWMNEWMINFGRKTVDTGRMCCFADEIGLLIDAEWERAIMQRQRLVTSSEPHARTRLVTSHDSGANNSPLFLHIPPHNAIGMINW